MHIPDGFLDGPTALATAGISLGAVAYSARRAGRELGERCVPLLGVTAAFIFAAQMVNFPVAGGTSGHLMGAALAAVLMGPWASVVVMTVVLTVQALGMADGGITALGGNVLNMGVLGGLVSYSVFAVLRRVAGGGRGRYLGVVAVTAWLSIALAAAAAAVELAFSGTVPLRVSLPAMLSVHAVIGVGEALITASVVAAVLKARPDLVRTYRADGETMASPAPVRLYPPAAGAPVGPAPLPRRPRVRGLIVPALALTLVVAGIAAPLASTKPDGLEFVAERQGFSGKAASPVWALAPLADYVFPAADSPALAVTLASLGAVVGLFVLAVAAGRAVAKTARGPALPGGHHPSSHPLGGHEHTDHKHSGHSHEGHAHLEKRDAGSNP